VKESADAVQNGGSVQYRIGDLLIDTGPQRVTRDGTVIALPKLSYDLLIALVRAAPNLLSIDALMQEVWPKLVVSPETVSQRVKLLRDALGDDPRNPRYLEGLRGRGYRLISPLETGIAARAPLTGNVPSLALENIAPAQDPSSAVSPLPPASARRSRLWAFLVAAACVLGAFGIRKIVQSEYPTPKTSVEVVAVPPHTVAVLPFENLSSEPDNGYIAIGMADAVLHRLSSLPELIVIARSSSFAIGKTSPDARDTGRRLGARYLVEGSVQRAGKELRVTAQLVDTATNNQLWSLNIDRTIDDVFAAQDQIAQRVAQQFDVTLHQSSAEYAELGTDAYLAFLKGRTLIGSRKVSDVEESIRQFSRAIALAPSFAAALAELASAKILIASLRDTPSKDIAPLWREVKPLLDRAIEIDPSAGEPYFLRAQYKLEPNNDPGGAEADFRKGLDLAPNYGPGLRMFAEYLFERKRYEDALVFIDRARLVDPLSAENHYRKGEMLRGAFHQREEAAALYLQALAVKPDFYPAYTRLAQVRFNQGRTAEAIKYGETSIAIEPQVQWTRDRLDWFYVDLGDLGAARDVVRGYPAGSSDIPLEQALICFRAGNLQQTEALARNGLKNPDAGDGLASVMATDAVVERAIAAHAPAAARQFIVALAEGPKDQGTLAVVTDNFPIVVKLATLEHFVGNHEVADRLAKDILTFLDHGGDVGALAGEEELARAQASALLGHNDAALDQLEKVIRSGRRVGWWVWLERDPTFAAIRTTPRFQAIAADTRGWQQSQLQLLKQMRLQGEVPTRSMPASPGGC
jgi:TolB-like protein/DNA-binding winged helix-turn-helix (wHTH) protein